MRIFILEDNSDRMMKFRRELMGHTIDHAETVEQGTSMVANNIYDLLFLDHDLGGEVMVDSLKNNTGYRLAEFIASFTPNKNTPCVVHSCNPGGAANIVNILMRAIPIPFPHLHIPSVIKWVELSQQQGVKNYGTK